MIIFSLFLIIGMLVIGGFGVDLMLYESQRTRVQATMDRAVLAAAHPAQTPGSVEARKDVVMSYFTSAGLGKYINRDDIEVEASGTASEVKAEARMHVDPLLLRFIGGTGFDAVGKGAAMQSAGLSEVSLVVDISGSMAWRSSSGNSKIYELRKAAKQFVNILLCNPNKPWQNTDCIMPKGTTSVSLVPYERQVVVGANLLKKFNRKGAHGNSYCASFYQDEFETTAFNPTLDIRQTGVFDYSESTSYDSASSSRFPCKTESWRAIVPLSDSASALGKRIGQLQAQGATSIDIGLKWGVTLLDPSVRSVVDGLTSEQTVSSSFIGRPLDYPVPNTQANTQKVIVLMTDGQNTSQPYLLDEFRSGPSRVWKNKYGSTRYTIHYENDPSTDKDDRWYWPWVSERRNSRTYYGKYMDHAYGAKPGFRYCKYKYYSSCREWETVPGNGNNQRAIQMDWREVWKKRRWGWWKKMPHNGRPGVMMDRYDKNYRWNSADNKDKRLLSLCKAAKDAGIKIYTIELETSSGGSGGSVLKKCASGDGYYFKVEGVDLVSTFSTIGQDIARLRLTE